MTSGPPKVQNNVIMFAAANGRGTQGPSDPSRPQTSRHLALLGQLPLNLQKRVRDFENLNIQVQTETLRELQTHTDEVDQLLFEASVERKSADPKYQKNDPFFIDPTIYKVMKGHIVDCCYEVPTKKGGVSRNQARFLEQLANDVERGRGSITLIGLDSGHPDIKRLGLDVPQSVPLRAKLDDKEPDNIVQITGIGGLLRLQREHSDHPAFKSQEETIQQARMMISPLYEIKHERGLVIKPPSEENEGVMVLENGLEIEMCNVRMVHIIGANEKALLTRGADEIYLGRPIRVWHEGAWHKAVIECPTGPRGLITVRTDERVHDGGFLDGHGLSVGRKSADLDLRDPATSTEREHPLMRHPEIRMGRCVAFIREGERQIGYIEQIISDQEGYLIQTTNGPDMIHFDNAEVEFLPRTDKAPLDHPDIIRGNKIVSFDSMDRKNRVYEILGYDEKTGRILAKMVSLRPRFAANYYYFDADDTSYSILGNGKEGLERFPRLRDQYKYPAPKVRFNWEGKILEGKLLTAETLPAFVEVIIEKDPSQLPSADAYNRYDVRLDDIIEVI